MNVEYTYVIVKNEQIILSNWKKHRKRPSKW